MHLYAISRLSSGECFYKALFINTVESNNKDFKGALRTFCVALGVRQVRLGYVRRVERGTESMRSTVSVTSHPAAAILTRVLQKRNP